MSDKRVCHENPFDCYTFTDNGCSCLSCMRKGYCRSKAHDQRHKYVPFPQKQARDDLKKAYARYVAAHAKFRGQLAQRWYDFIDEE